MKIELIQNLKISEATLKPFYERLGKREIQFMVFRTKYKNKTFFCAFCGGLFKENELYLTDVGKAAFEGLANLQMGNNAVCLRELKGKTKNDIENKIIETFEWMENYTSIIFIGDFSGELDDPISKIISYEKPISKQLLKRRSGLPLTIRFEVFKRDLYSCQICGKSAKDGVCLEIDHIIPKSRGGDDSLNNLQTLCYDCNRGKRDKLQ